MSRTYRKIDESYYHANGEFYTIDEWSEYHDAEKISLGITSWYFHCPSWNWASKSYYHKKGRDKKPWNKPPKWYKQMARRTERAKIQSAMIQERYENIPLFKHNDQWNWT